MQEFLVEKIEIPLVDRSYEISVGSGLDHILNISQLPKGSGALIVTNRTVGPLYEKELREVLLQRYAFVHTVSLPDGEEYKNWDTLQIIFGELLGRGHDRQTVLFALGGGVVGDITGFAAACYMRGVKYVQIPTTLLAQVDSSVGGKTGINHPLGKNMIGSFHQPSAVLCNVDFLQTLPARELRAGIAEVIKYGPIADMKFFGWLEVSIDDLLKGDREALVRVVRRCCEIKAAIVGADERESGLRAVLNFGHTFGHAIETGLGYGKWLHGEGVAAGMVMAAELSRRLGLIDIDFVERLRKLIVRAGLPSKGPVLDSKDNAGRYLELMRNDKKSAAGELRFVVIEEPGKAALMGAPETLVRQTIEACC